jgi:hypothetical protein
MPFPGMKCAVCLSLALLLPGAGAAQEANQPPKPARLFEGDATLHLTLHGPWRRITRNPSSPERYPGSLEYTGANGENVDFTVEITTRGLTRRDRVCDFPPLKLWFDRQLSKGTAFRGQASLKMVTHCDTNRRFQDYYVKEYLAYRIYNLVTPFSFRVRPLMVTYVDSEGDGEQDPEVRFGFLIEDVDDMAERNGLVELEIPQVPMYRLDPVQTSNYMVFQYLIGNLDWSVQIGPDAAECCHNSKLIGIAPEATPVYPVPYDLDSSGLVNAHYASPPDQLPVRSIQQRYYRGYCAHNDQLPGALDRFRAQRAAILELLRDEPRLGNRSRARAIDYVEEFFSSIADPDHVRKRLVDRCRQ